MKKLSLTEQIPVSCFGKVLSREALKDIQGGNNANCPVPLCAGGDSSGCIQACIDQGSTSGTCEPGYCVCLIA